MRNCIMCGTPIEGRSDKVLCSSTCTVRRFRLRALAKDRFADVLYSLQNKDNIAQLIKDLEKLVEEIDSGLSPTT